MREALSLDGWMKEEALPMGWRVRRPSLNKVTFLTNTAELLRSQEEAIQYISTNLHSYDISEVDQIKRFMEEIKHWVKPQKKSRKLINHLNSAWTEEKCLPEGWMLRAKLGRRGSIEVKAPSGEKFSDFKSVHLHLAREGRKEAALLLEKLYLEGYGSNSSLPEGWIVKNSGARLVSILTTEGIELKSYKAALEHLHSEEGYDEESVEDLRMFIDESRKRTKNKLKA